MTDRRIRVLLTPIELDVLLAAARAVQSEVEADDRTTWTQDRVDALTEVTSLLVAATPTPATPARPTTPAATERPDRA